ncbi:MAG TPA: hypothetical protein VE968_07750 [Sphingomicrobium sp.]|nr:hypothetical protein [Sphingomicrobium sp.]
MRSHSGGGLDFVAGFAIGLSLVLIVFAAALLARARRKSSR